MKTKQVKSAQRAQEMRELLGEFDGSGETVKAFCERKGVSAWSIYYWRRRLREGPDRKAVRDQRPALVPVRVIDGPEVESVAYEVGLRGGRTVKVQPGFNSSELERLLQVLERC